MCIYYICVHMHIDIDMYACTGIEYFWKRAQEAQS